MHRLVRALVPSLLLTASVAQAGNDDTYFMSSRAALVGGAVAAVDGDAGAVWYNPAGLGTIERQQLDLSLTVAAWQGRQIDAGLLSTIGGREISTTLDGNRSTIVSPSTVFVRKLGKLTVGGGVFVSRDDVADVEGRNEATVGDLQGSSWAAIRTEDTRYHLGVATGFPVGKRLRLGFGLFGIYEGVDADLDMALNTANTQDPSRDLALQAGYRSRSTRWELEVTAGLQADLYEGLHLGFLLRSPVVLLHEAISSQLAVTGGAVVGGVIQDFDPAPERAGRPGVLEPARMVLSLCYLDARWGVYAEGDWHHALRRDDRDDDPADTDWLVDREALWNLRAGAHWDVTEALRVGAGFFTDRSAKRGSEEPTDFDVDYYGISTGATLTQRIRLAKSEREDDLLFRTSLSLRYALGVGETAQLRVDPDTFAIDNSNTVDVRFHELYMMLGSGLHF